MTPGTTTSAPITTAEPTTVNVPVTSTTPGTTTIAPTVTEIPTEAPTTEEPVTTTTTTAEPTIECPLDMSDSTKIPTAAMKPTPKTRKPEYVEWDSDVIFGTLFEAEVLISPLDELPLAKRMTITPNLRSVKVEIIFTGSDAPVGSPEYETTVTQETTSENEQIKFPSTSKKMPPYIRTIVFRILSLVDGQRKLILKLNLECCIKPGNAIHSCLSNNLF
jgi:hypothetical protein